MKRRSLLGALAALPLAGSLPAWSATPIHVFKNPSCGCCLAWIDHLKAAGFAVKVTDTDDTISVRQRLGMPDRFGSCHTATIEGYVLEGHVPASDVKRMLSQRPKALGLAVPGMPVGSPGMEYGDRKDPYDVFLVERNGSATVFASYAK